MYLIRFTVRGWNHRRRLYCVSWYLHQSAKAAFQYSIVFCEICGILLRLPVLYFTAFCGICVTFTAFRCVYCIESVFLRFTAFSLFFSVSCIYRSLLRFTVFFSFLAFPVFTTVCSLLRFTVFTTFYCLRLKSSKASLLRFAVFTPSIKGFFTLWGWIPVLCFFVNRAVAVERKHLNTVRKNNCIFSEEEKATVNHKDERRETG